MGVLVTWKFQLPVLGFRVFGSNLCWLVLICTFDFKESAQIQGLGGFCMVVLFVGLQFWGFEGFQDSF